MATEARRYTVAELIAALAELPQDAPVEALSGCHDCGGPMLDVGFSDHNGPAVYIVGDEPEGCWNCGDRDYEQPVRVNGELLCASCADPFGGDPR